MDCLALASVSHEGRARREGDFVIVIPRVGVLLLEVKDGHLVVRDGHWFQNKKRMTKTPRRQTLDYRDKLKTLLVERGLPPEELPIMGIACAFPDMAFNNSPSFGDLDGLVLGKRETTRPWPSSVQLR